MREELQAILDRELADLCREIDPDHGLLRKLLSKGVLNDEQFEACKAKTTTASRVEEIIHCMKRRKDEVYDKFRQILEPDHEQFVKEHLPPIEVVLGQETKYTRVEALAGSRTFDAQVDGKEIPGRPGGIHPCYIVTSVVVLVAAVGAFIVQFTTIEKSAVKTMPFQQESQQGEQSKDQNLFRAAFENRRAELTDDIDVEHGLLIRMMDRNVLTREHVEDIKSQKTHSEKVSRMLELLEKRDSSLFNGFCEALRDNGQRPIVEKYFQKYYRNEN